MKEHADDYISQLLASGQERREVEFKAPFSWSDPANVWIREKTIRAALAMHNLPDGGAIVIGVEEQSTGPAVVKGISPTELQSFQDEEAIADTVCSFSTEPVVLSVANGQFTRPDGVRVDVLIIEVSGFADLPAICRKDGQARHNNGKGRLILEKDAIYVRAKKGRNASYKVTEHELREIIRHAVSSELDRLRGFGLVTSSKFGASIITDDQQFETQIRDAWGP